MRNMKSSKWESLSVTAEAERQHWLATALEAEEILKQTKRRIDAERSSLLRELLQGIGSDHQPQRVEERNSDFSPRTTDLTTRPSALTPEEVPKMGENAPADARPPPCPSRNEREFIEIDESPPTAATLTPET